MSRTPRARVLHRRFDVVHGEADVMGAFPPPRQEPRRAALADGGRQKLNRAVSAVKKGYFHAVIRRVDPLQQPETENAAIGRKCSVQAMHDNADVIDLRVGELHIIFLHQVSRYAEATTDVFNPDLLAVGVHLPAGEIHVRPGDCAERQLQKLALGAHGNRPVGQTDFTAAGEDAFLVSTRPRALISTSSGTGCRKRVVNSAVMPHLCTSTPDP